MSDHGSRDDEPKKPALQAVPPPSEPDSAGATRPPARPDGRPRMPEPIAAPPAASRSSFSLGERLQQLKRHPVLLFGTLASGKSSILMSFIVNLKKNNEVHIRLGEPIYPVSEPRRNEAHAFAVEFFERTAEAFMHDGKILASTEIPYPVFIPIDIQRSTDPEPVRFAFLEGRGDWYERSSSSEGSLYQDFQSEVIDVLKLYASGLSAIFAAPYMDPENRDRLHGNDVGLSGALKAYQRYRERQNQDSLLYLLTKWDLRASPINDRKFAELDESDVKQILAELYPASWTEFQAMPRPIGNDGRFFMQYCAAYLVDNFNRALPEDRRELFDRYPRTLLNWLYGNATRITDSERISRESVLFPDVIDRARARIRIFEQVADFIFVRK